MAETKARKWIVWIVAAAVAIAALMALTTHRQSAPIVPVASISRDNVVSALSSNGKVEPIAPTTARAQFPTFVAEVKATEGQSVKKGQVILMLDSADVRAQLSQARADLLAAQNDLKNSHGGGPPDERSATARRPCEGTNASGESRTEATSTCAAPREESRHGDAKSPTTTLH